MKKKSKDILGSIFIVSLILVVAYIFVYMFIFSGEASPSIIFVTVVLIIFLTVLVTISFGRLFRKSPPILRIAIAGYANTGKTVYITVLFNQLLTNLTYKKISFSPLGDETINRITKDWLTLANGNFLAPTSMGSAFSYEAFVELSKYQRYRLEIKDYAGEESENELSSEDFFFHKSDFINYMVNCDAIFFAIDIKLVLLTLDNLNILYEPDSSYINKIQHDYISAINSVHNRKNIVIGKKIKFPVVLLFLKADLIQKRAEDDKKKYDEIVKRIIGQFDELFGFCNKNCLSFNHYFVSSVGTDDLLEIQGKINPSEVVEPIIWVINNMRT